MGRKFLNTVENHADKKTEDNPQSFTSSKRTQKLPQKSPTRPSISTKDIFELVKENNFEKPAASTNEMEDALPLKSSDLGSITKKAEKRGRRSKVRRLSSEYDSTDTDLSVDDVIKGVISSVDHQSNSCTKRTSSRKAKKIAASLVAVADSDDSDDAIDKDDNDSDDDYDIEQDCNNMLKEARTNQRLLKRGKRTSLDKGDNTPSISPQVAKSPSLLENNIYVGDQSPTRPRSRDEEKNLAEVSLTTSSGSDNEAETSSPKRKKPRLKPSASVPSADQSRKIKLCENEMVALKPDGKWADRPLVGKIVKLSETSIEIVWYFGTYSSKWREWSSLQDDDVKVQRETVSRDRVLTEGFHLTSSKKLPVKVAKQLRSLYASVDRK